MKDKCIFGLMFILFLSCMISESERVKTREMFKKYERNHTLTFNEHVLTFNEHLPIINDHRHQGMYGGVMR